MLKKISLFALCSLILLGVCGCGNNQPIEETPSTPQPKISYEDITKDSITNLVEVKSYISLGMSYCPNSNCYSKGYFKNFTISPLYNNVEFENVTVSLDYEVICYTDMNYNNEITVTAHIGDFVLDSTGNYNQDSELVSFGNNQKCFQKKSDRIIVTQASGRIKITEYE